MTEEKQTILVVDDVEINIDMLLEMLGEDHTVRVALDGESALKSVAKAPPDLILLDVMMPGVDGFEVCRRLKADPATRHIPIIFLTALSEDADESRGLDLGAVDYITKPFNPATVKARVRNHLELKAYRDRLESLVADRTRELEEAHGRLKALDAAKQDYLRTISHELRTPVNGILGVAELALEEMADQDLRETYVGIYERSRERILVAIENALKLAESQGADAAVETTPVDLWGIVGNIGAAMAAALSGKTLSLLTPEPVPCFVLGNEEIMRQGISTVLNVAERMATPGTPVSVVFDNQGEKTIMRVEILCPPMTEKLQGTFFDTFSYARSGSLVEDLGLAVPLVAALVRSMGGDVAIRNTPTGVAVELSFLTAGVRS
jgi:CheY-like chemotaxis protein